MATEDFTFDVTTAILTLFALQSAAKVNNSLVGLKAEEKCRTNVILGLNSAPKSMNKLILYGERSDKR